MVRYMYLYIRRYFPYFDMATVCLQFLSLNTLHNSHTIVTGEYNYGHLSLFEIIRTPANNLATVEVRLVVRVVEARKNVQSKW